MLSNKNQTEMKISRFSVPSTPSKVYLRTINPHITCDLCKGYLIDATTIVECLHSFCHSCIMMHLRRETYCPSCEMMINKLKPNIKPDSTLQAIVYKIVPGLYERELLRRRAFYKLRTKEALLATPEQRGDDTEHLIFGPTENISLMLEYLNNKNWHKYINTENDGTVSFCNDNSDYSVLNNEALEEQLKKPKYLQCPAIFTITNLKKFIIFKFGIDATKFTVEIMYKVKCIALPDHYTLMDVAYIYTWKRDAPMRFFYCVRNTSEKDKETQFLPFTNEDKQIMEMETDSDNNTISDKATIDNCRDVMSKEDNQSATVDKSQMQLLSSSSCEMESDTQSAMHTETTNGPENNVKPSDNTEQSIKNEQKSSQAAESVKTTSQPPTENTRKIPDLLQIIKPEKIGLNESKTETQSGEKTERKFDMRRFDELVLRPKATEETKSMDKIDDVNTIKTEKKVVSGPSNMFLDVKNDVAKDKEVKSNDDNLLVQHYNKNEFLNSFNLTPKSIEVNDKIPKCEKTEKQTESPSPTKKPVESSVSTEEKSDQVPMETSEIPSAEERAEKTEDKSVEKVAEKLVVEKPATKATEMPTEKPVIKSVPTPMEKPVEKSIEKSLQKLTEKSLEKSMEKLLDRSVSKQKTVEKPPAKSYLMEKPPTPRPFIEPAEYYKEFRMNLEALKKSMQLEALSNHMLDATLIPGTSSKTSVINKKMLWPLAETKGAIDINIANVEKKEKSDRVKSDLNKSPYLMTQNTGNSSVKSTKTHHNRKFETFGEKSKSTSDTSPSTLLHNDQKSCTDVVPRKLPVPLKPKPLLPASPCGSMKNSSRNDINVMNMNISLNDRMANANKALRPDFNSFYFDPSSTSMFNKPEHFIPIPPDPGSYLPKSFPKDNQELIDAIVRKNSLGTKRKYFNETKEIPSKEQRVQNILDSCNIMFPSSLSVTMTNKNIDPSLLFESKMKSSVNNYIEIFKLPEKFIKPDDTRPAIEAHMKGVSSSTITAPSKFQPSTSSSPKINSFTPVDYRQLPCTDSFQTKFLESINSKLRLKDGKEKKLSNFRRTNETVTKAHNSLLPFDTNSTASKNNPIFKGDLKNLFNLKPDSGLQVTPAKPLMTSDPNAIETKTSSSKEIPIAPKIPAAKPLSPKIPASTTVTTTPATTSSSLAETSVTATTTTTSPVAATLPKIPVTTTATTTTVTTSSASSPPITPKIPASTTVTTTAVTISSPLLPSVTATTTSLTATPVTSAKTETTTGC